MLRLGFAHGITAEVLAVAASPVAVVVAKNTLKPDSRKALGLLPQQQRGWQALAVKAKSRQQHGRGSRQSSWQ